VCFVAQSSIASNTNTTARSTKQRKQRKTKWDIILPRLQEFHRIHGHSLVTEQDDDKELYKWTRDLRYNYIHQIRNATTAVGKRYRRKLSQDQIQALEDLDFVWETKPTRKVKRWHVMIQRLKAYGEKHGHIRISNKGDSELFDWTKSIRYNYRHQVLNTTTTSNNKRRPRLSKPKLKQLQDLGFDWGTTRNAWRWDVMLPKLQAFQEVHGHAMVLPADDLELYQWMKSIRATYRHQILNAGNSPSSSYESPRRRRPRLSQAKLTILNDLGFCWTHSTMSWERRYQELRDFRKKYGHCHVSSSDNSQLNGFVHRQRQEYRRYLAGNSTSMTVERIELLSRINFEWAKSHELSWEERRTDLEDYWERGGHSNVPQDYNTNYQLGQWCMNQRTKYRRNQDGDHTGLTSERIRKLEKLNFEWSYRRKRWNFMFERLQKYQEENSHLEISTVDVDNADLRQWLNEQRYFYRTTRTSRMTPERIEWMETIPDFSWRRRREGGPSKSDWDELFVAMKEKGIVPDGKAKEHWFDGVNPFETEVKTEWTEKELLALWNSDIEDDKGDEGDEGFEDAQSKPQELLALWNEGIEDDEVDEGDEGDEFFEDEQSTLFLRA
jgi:hypothetical protein